MDLTADTTLLSFSLLHPSQKASDEMSSGLSMALKSFSWIIKAWQNFSSADRIVKFKLAFRLAHPLKGNSMHYKIAYNFKIEVKMQYQHKQRQNGLLPFLSPHRAYKMNPTPQCLMELFRRMYDVWWVIPFSVDISNSLKESWTKCELRFISLCSPNVSCSQFRKRSNSSECMCLSVSVCSLYHLMFAEMEIHAG